MNEVVKCFQLIESILFFVCLVVSFHRRRPGKINIIINPSSRCMRKIIFGGVKINIIMLVNSPWANKENFKPEK